MPLDLNTGSDDFKDHRLLILNKINEIELVAKTALDCIGDTDAKVLDLSIEQVRLKSTVATHSKFFTWLIGTATTVVLGIAGWLIKVYFGGE